MDAVLPQELQLFRARLASVYNFVYCCEITKMEDKQNLSMPRQCFTFNDCLMKIN